MTTQRSAKGCWSALLASVLLGCGPTKGTQDDGADGTSVGDEPAPTWMIGVFSRSAANQGPLVGDNVASVYLVEFTDDGSVIRRDVTGCGQYESTFASRWTLTSPDEIQVESDDDDRFSIVRTAGCHSGLQQLLWEYPSGLEEPLWRGEKCLESIFNPQDPDEEEGEVLPGDTCRTVWCDEPPPPCEE